MYVERWEDLIGLLDDLYPMLKPVHKAGALIMKAWANANKYRHHGLLDANIALSIKAFNDIIPYLPDEWVPKCNHAIAFLNALNNHLNPDWLETEIGCLFWDFYWWDGGCHPEVMPPPPPPPPPPPVKVCSDHTNQTDCLTAGCYWYDQACHDQPYVPPEPPEPPEPPRPPPPRACEDFLNETACLSNGCYWYDGGCHMNPKVIPPILTDPMKELAKQLAEYCATIPLTKPIQKASCVALTVTLKVLSGFFDWQRRR